MMLIFITITITITIIIIIIIVGVVDLSVFAFSEQKVVDWCTVDLHHEQHGHRHSLSRI